MSVALLRGLRGLKVLVIHPADEEGLFLVDHLRRIGCMVTSTWPVPTELPAAVEVMFLAIEDESRPAIERLLKSMGQPRPTMVAIVSYENPSTLQMVLESGALAVVERPVKPFGLLTNLAIARSLWLERQNLVKDLRKLKRKVQSDQKMAKAKAILMAAKNLKEEEAYQYIRRQAMSKRLSMEDIAGSIINAEDLLNLSPKGA